MCHQKFEISLDDAPHPTPQPLEILESVGELTCARMIAYLDNSSGIVLCHMLHRKSNLCEPILTAMH